ncbi:MAG: ABC transporter permease [Candidatus Omnitrophica bacterium]|nr:ABC transporter permease [Candidatus Omnitrophota bacterium]MCM8827311.1 ABC transporter permease [Candidatus Omnitrophota bacterium]
MNLVRSWAIVLRQLYLMRCNYSRVISIFIWVFVDILLWGFLTKYLITLTHKGINFTSLILGAVLLWDFFSRIMHGITMAFFEDVWARNFINLFSTPITVGEYLLGLILSSTLIGSFAFTIMLLVAMIIFGFSFLAYGITIIPFLLILLIFGISLGIISVSLVLRLGPSAEWIIWPIPAILSPFVGVFYPISVLPTWLQILSKSLPPSYVFEALRSILFYKVFSIGDLLVGGVLVLIYLGSSSAIFLRTFNYCIRRGILYKFNAENIT